MNPGKYKGLSSAEYDRIPALRSSILRRIIPPYTPAHCRYYQENGAEESEAQTLGDATHGLLLEPDRFAAEFAVRPYMGHPNAKATKIANEAWAQANAGRSAISEEQMADLLTWREALMSQPKVAGLLTGGGYTEYSLVWDDELTGLRCKARLDRLTSEDGHPIVAELKTARSARAHTFAGDCERYAYHVQAAFYLRGVRAVFGGGDPRHAFIVLEKGDAKKGMPPLARIFRLKASALALGDTLCDIGLKRYRECLDSGIWPGYSPDEEIDVPKYAYQDEPGTSIHGFGDWEGM